jgi:hypothetical protein
MTNVRQMITRGPDMCTSSLLLRGDDGLASNSMLLNSGLSVLWAVRRAEFARAGWLIEESNWVLATGGGHNSKCPGVDMQSSTQPPWWLTI